jgi:hypothetical protein
MKYNEKIMLGEPIGEMKGKITSQRVIDVEGSHYGDKHIS